MTLEERYGKAIANVGGTLPPLGLISLGTMAKQAGHSVMILDGSRLDYHAIMTKLAEEKPDIIGWSVMTFAWPKANVMISQVKSRLPGVFTVVGGAHATICKRTCLQECSSLDAVVFGEGEYTLLELMARIEKAESLKGVCGLIYREHGEIHENPPRELIKDINVLPVPDRGLVDLVQYVPAFSQYKKMPVTNMFTTRGCPYRCIFCFPDLLGNKVRFRSPELVVEEIKCLQRQFGIKEVAFWDDTFTVDRNRVMTLSRLIKTHVPDLCWSAQARADKVDEEILQVMREAGCWKLHFGLESLVQKNLDFLRKGTTVDQNLRAVEMTKKSGMEVEASFIFGIPGETYEEGLFTIRQAARLNIDYARFFSLTPYGDLQREWRKYGVLITEDMSKYQGNEIVFVPHSMTYHELERLISYAYIKFYFRPAYIVKRVKKLTSFRAIWNSLRGAKAVLMIVQKGVNKV